MRHFDSSGFEAYGLDNNLRADFFYSKLRCKIESKYVFNEIINLVINPKLIKSIGWNPKVNFHNFADLMLKEI